MKGVLRLPVATILLASVLYGTSCNLSIDTDAYPYTPIAEIGISAPELIFTEILAITSNAGPAIEERGEFIEIKNIGNVAIDPKTIFIELENTATEEFNTIQISTPTTQEAIEATQNLKPIQPGEYFVFVRYETERIELKKLLENKQYYDYGKFGTSKVELDQTQSFSLKLSYLDEEKKRVVLSDTLEWTATGVHFQDGELPWVLDHSISVNASNETNAANNQLSSWCIEDTLFGFEGIFGTPGAASHCMKEPQ